MLILRQVILRDVDNLSTFIDAAESSLVRTIVSTIRKGLEPSCDLRRCHFLALSASVNHFSNQSSERTA